MDLIPARDFLADEALLRSSLAEIYATLGICADYGSLALGERVALLCRDIADRRPLIPADISRFSASTRETIDTFRMIHEAVTGPHRGAIQSYQPGQRRRRAGAAADRAPV